MLGRLRDMRQCNFESQNLKLFPTSAAPLTEPINTPIVGNSENVLTAFWEVKDGVPGRIVGNSEPIA